MTPRFYTLKEAAQLAGVSLSTLRRNRDRLRSVGAICDSRGWQVTQDQLAAAGLLDTVQPVNSEQVPNDTPDTPSVEALRQEINALQARLAESEKQLAVAEALAHERLDTINAQRATLCLIEPPATPTQPTKHRWHWFKHRPENLQPN